MANSKQIKKRVGSIKNIGKITKALEMVSASKVQKLTEKAQKAKPYARLVYELVSNLAGDVEAKDVPLMKQPEVPSSDLYILITTNRGLVGSLNTNLLKFAMKLIEGSRLKHKFITVGRKGRVFAAANGELIADLSDEKDDQRTVSALIKLITEGFMSSDFDAVYIIYSDFITALTQEPTVKKLLPVSNEFASKDEAGFELMGRNEEVSRKVLFKNYYYEPNATFVLNYLLPFYLETQLTESLYEARASEHSARMIAMKNASENSKDLSESLTIEYNKVRQSSITTEISDITTAQQSLL
jgi:F-type H+-transporting ATPase subunit gamma